MFSLQPFQVFSFSFSIGIQPILWKLLSHLKIHVKGLKNQRMPLLPGFPSWLEHTGDIHTCRSWRNHSPLGSTITQALLQWDWKRNNLNNLPIVNRVAMKSPMKMTGLTSSCLGSTPAAAAAGASSSSCSSPAEAPGSSSAIFTSTVPAVLKSLSLGLG